MDYVTQPKPLTADACFLSAEIWRRMAATAEKAGKTVEADICNANADHAERTAFAILEGRYMEPAL